MAFIADRVIRKPSPHTLKAYRQDFTALATAITKEATRTAFATHADTHEAASIRRSWSNWNTLCDFLFRGGLIVLNPMSLVGRPKAPKSLPKGLAGETVSGLLTAIDHDGGPGRRSDWAERDPAIVLTAVLAGLRADELVHTDVGDIRPTDEAGVIHVRSKGNKGRRIPVEQGLIRELEGYLDSRAARFPDSTKRRLTKGGLGAWPAAAPLFVGSDGQRITRGTWRYRVLRAFKKAGLNSQRAPGASVHGFRHMFETELTNVDVSVDVLMKLRRHESMVTAQRYFDGAGTENRAAGAQNPLCGLIEHYREP